MGKDYIVYENNLRSLHLKSVVKTALFYICEIIAWLVVAKLYGNFGVKVMTPLISLMWLAGAITTFFIKEERAETIKQTKWFIYGYIGLLFLYRLLVQYIASISIADMTASLNISMATVSGAAASGFLQNMLMILSVFTPLAFITWCAKKFVTYHGKMTKQDAFAKIKDIR